MKMRIAAVAAALAAILGAGPVAADQLSRAWYMNVSYCAGVAESYGERLATSSSHASSASGARSLSRMLARKAEAFGRRNGFSAAEGARARAQGVRTMAGMLPDGGAWARGGAIPGEAFRQYQHCATLAEL